jgi:predicted Zn-dependent protease
MRRLLHWEHFPLHLYFVPSDLTTKERKDAVQAGCDQWVHATNDFVRYEVVTKAALADVTVTFLPHESVPDQGGACGHTTMTFLALTLKSASIVLATTDVTPADLQAITAHEFGHALGIDGHSDDPSDLMYAVLTRSAANDLPVPSHTLTSRDLNTLKVCYPALVVPPASPAKSAP